jgi:hypothetical protein
VTPEVREFIAQSRFGRPAVEQLAAMLPETDADLDSWIDAAVRDSDTVAFMLLSFATLSRGRRLDARHLVGGAKLMGAPQYMMSIALRTDGEMPEYLLQGMRNTALYHWTHVMGLLSVAIWCEEHRGGVYPDEMFRQGRSIARLSKTSLEVDAFLMELGARTKDAELLALVRQHYPKGGTEAAWEKVIQTSRTIAGKTISDCRLPVLETVPQTPVDPLHQTETVRRSVPRIGRNEPCHCGSGKKYKNCHQEQDRERLHQSSNVAGVTRKELHDHLENHLTLERLQKLSGADLGRMDPAEIPRHLLPEYFVRLGLFDVDRATEFLEKLGYADDLEDGWIFIMFAAVRAGRKDIGERMFKLREPFGFPEGAIRLNHRLLLAQDDPAKSVQLIEDAARNALKTNDPDDLSEIAYATLFSKFSGLGVLLYRSVLPFLAEKSVQQSYEQIQLVRDRLGLPTDDPIREMLPTFLKDPDELEASLQDVEEKLENKRREVRSLRESLDQVQKDLARHVRTDAQDSQAAAAAVGAAAEHDPRLDELKERVRRLESDLKERHNERNALQRNLDKAHANLETLRNLRQKEAEDADESDTEDDLLLPQDAESTHPVRLIEFPRNFNDRLGEFPHHVSRAAMVMLGRLAGGDAAAFSGAKRLKSRPNVVRQRIGIDFRLLFRLLPDRIQVIDLIPRQDMERRIKAL